MKSFNKEQLLSTLLFMKAYFDNHEIENNLNSSINANVTAIYKGVKENKLYEYFSPSLKEEFLSVKFKDSFQYKQSVAKYAFFESKVRINQILEDFSKIIKTLEKLNILELSLKKKAILNACYSNICLDVNNICKTFLSCASDFEQKYIKKNSKLKDLLYNIAKTFNLSQELLPTKTNIITDNLNSKNVTIAKQDPESNIDAIALEEINTTKNISKKPLSFAFIYGDVESVVENNIEFLLKIIGQDYIPDGIVFLCGSRRLDQISDPCLLTLKKTEKLIQALGKKPQIKLQPNGTSISLPKELSLNVEELRASQKDNLSASTTLAFETFTVKTRIAYTVFTEIDMIRQIFDVRMKEASNRLGLRKVPESETINKIDTKEVLKQRTKDSIKERTDKVSISTYHTELVTKIYFINSPGYSESLTERPQESTYQSSVEDFFAHLINIDKALIDTHDINIWSISSGICSSIFAQDLETTLASINIQANVFPCSSATDPDTMSVKDLLKVILETMDNTIESSNNPKVLDKLLSSKRNFKMKLK